MAYFHEMCVATQLVHKFNIKKDQLRENYEFQFQNLCPSEINKRLRVKTNAGTSFKSHKNQKCFHKLKSEN